MMLCCVSPVKYRQFTPLFTDKPIEYVTILQLAMENNNSLVDFMNRKAAEYSTRQFIMGDPVQIPHLFTKKQDREIAGFFAAIFAWGNRTTIIAKSRELMGMMDMRPHDFCLHASARELRPLADFRHRTFNGDDLLCFVEFFRRHYRRYNSLETAFSQGMDPGDITVEKGLVHFRQYFFAEEHLRRTEKHIASPLQHSACKRINMFLRWMVRKDEVDLGLWTQIRPAQLVCPLDLHVMRVAKRFGLVTRKQADWQAALELTENLRRLDPADPVRFDLALFGLGIIEKY
jgi:uncharacterized protein (TIGR02757 family)